jgi:deazaflavin-dependent oxidoreductase (nitroreductase family)
LPRWLARFNRRVTNRILMRLAERPPYCALHHSGRTTGKPYVVPLNAFPGETGFVFALTYGPGADWVRNVMAAGSAVLEYGGESIELATPRLVPRHEVWRCFPRYVRFALRLLGTRDFMVMARAH